MSRIELFVFPTSPYAMKVGCYLAFRKIDYQMVGVSPISFKQVAFTKLRQVPVLRLQDEWKLDSSPIMLWLEEKYPGSQLLGTSTSEQEKIQALDTWVSTVLIPSMFRVVVDWPSVLIGLRNGWKLSYAVHQSTPLPAWVRLLWPMLLRKAKFIVAMMDTIDRSKSLHKAQNEIINEFIMHLAGGPYLGGNQTPSLADLSAFPVIVFPYRFGLLGDAPWIENPEVLRWIGNVQKHLPENPFLVDDTLLIRDLPAI